MPKVKIISVEPESLNYRNQNDEWINLSGLTETFLQIDESFNGLSKANITT